MPIGHTSRPWAMGPSHGPKIALAGTMAQANAIFGPGPGAHDRMGHDFGPMGMLRPPCPMARSNVFLAYCFMHRGCANLSNPCELPNCHDLELITVLSMAAGCQQFLAAATLNT